MSFSSAFQDHTDQALAACGMPRKDRLPNPASER